MCAVRALLSHHLQLYLLAVWRGDHGRGHLPADVGPGGDLAQQPDRHGHPHRVRLHGRLCHDRRGFLRLLRRLLRLLWGHAGECHHAGHLHSLHGIGVSGRSDCRDLRGSGERRDRDTDSWRFGLYRPQLHWQWKRHYRLFTSQVSLLRVGQLHGLPAELVVPEPGGNRQALCAQDVLPGRGQGRGLLPPSQLPGLQPGGSGRGTGLGHLQRPPAKGLLQFSAGMVGRPEFYADRRGGGDRCDRDIRRSVRGVSLSKPIRVLRLKTEVCGHRHRVCLLTGLHWKEEEGKGEWRRKMRVALGGGGSGVGRGCWGGGGERREAVGKDDTTTVRI
ncbi:uncharacterized protein LOC143301163 isoform X1 [Babylonia areolata]|uniref:uncharacterized protein LOC143301163 isoform X1 n=1 Tax=Babylonia areolata TaxID=304850 RepID=UPI003FD457C9